MSKKTMYLAKTKTGVQVVEPMEADHFRFYQEVELEEIDVTTIWTGPKMKLAQWREVLAFFEAGNTKHKAEQQVRIFFNRETGLFKFWAFPQRAVGMSTSEIEDHPDRKIQEAEIGAGFVLWGSIHHHCSSHAYQSGVDSANESGNGSQGVGWAGQGGIHITVGGLGSKQYTIHGRVVLRGSQNDVVWSQWFEPPDGSEAMVTEMMDHLKKLRKWKGLFPNLPDDTKTEVMEKIVKATLCTPPADDTQFPKIWMDNIITTYQSPMGFGHHHQGDRPHVIVPRSFYPEGNGKHKHMSTVQPGAISKEEYALVDEVLEIGERYRTVAYRALSLLKYQANMNGGHGPADRDDHEFLKLASGVINKSNVMFRRVIECMDIILEAELEREMAQDMAASDMGSPYNQ